MAEPNQLPPINDTDSGVRMKSEPPQVKAARIQWDSIENIVVILGACVLCGMHSIDQSMWLAACVPASFGSGVLRHLQNRGMLKAQTAGLVSGGLVPLLMFAAKPVGAMLAGGARFLLVFIAIAFHLLSGCASIDKRIDAARAHVKYAGEALAHLRANLDVECVQPPTAPEWCPPLIDDFNRIDAAYTALNGAMP